MHVMRRRIHTCSVLYAIMVVVYTMKVVVYTMKLYVFL